MKRHFISVLVLTCCLGPLQCATLERLSLDEMITESTAIVRGKVAGSYTALSGRVIYTHYSIQVSERLKGAGQATMDVAVPGGATGKLRQTFSGAPELKPGEEYVLFLWTGRSGLTQVIGYTQGVFRISGASTNPTASRAATRELMLARRTGQPVNDEAVSMPLSELRGRIAQRLGGRSVLR